nr:hypothetical protein [Tanacetum cinerariifolium]
SLESSEDSVGTPTGRVILFSTISTTIPDTTPVITPPTTQTDTTVIPTETPIIAPTIPPSLDYTPASLDYSPTSDKEFDPSEDPSLGHIPPLPAVSPFLSSDDDTTDSDTPDTPPSPTHGTLFTKTTASTQRSPVIPRRRVMILALGQPIPHGRSYCYHPNGPVHMMTARKRVGPLPVPQPTMRHSFDHSSLDLPSTSTGPSHKRCRSPMTSVPALPLISRALSLTRADLIPSPKRVRDIGYLTDVNVGPRKTRVERVTHLAMPEDIPEPTQEGAVIEGVQREQGHRIVGVEKMPNTRSRASMTHEEVEELVARRVSEEMEAREAARNIETLNENKGNGGNRNRDNGGNGGNGNRGNRGNGNHGMKYGGFMPMAQECTFQDFLKCKPHTLLRTEGVVRLTHWFEKIETVFNISNCPSKYQVKYATCTLQDSGLTWWNSHKRAIGVDAAYAMKWAGLMKLMIEVYCPRNEELILLCTRMVLDEEDRVERFIGRLPDNIQGNVIAANLARLQDAIRIANQLMDKKLQGYAARSDENKKGWKVTQGITVDSNRHSRGKILLGRIPGHFRKDFPKLRNQNRGNQTRNKTRNKTGGNEVTAKAYAIDTSYAIELSDERVSETNIILRGCTLGFLGHLFNINLMLIELGSFDVIIGMDWLANYHALIVYDGKVIRIHYGDEVLIIRGLPSASYVQEG